MNAPYPYYISSDALQCVATFVELVNAALDQTGVSFDPSYGGISVDHMLVGNLRSTGDGVVLDVS